MLKNNLILAWRQMQKKPGLSLFKILGLGLGIGVSLLLIKYISWHWNFDRFYVNANQIVRVQHNHYSEGILSSSSAMTYSGIPVIVKDRLPEVKDYTRLGRWIANDVVFRYEENLYRGKDCFFADPSFFDFFSFNLILGDPKTALVDPNSLVVTESTAETLFGDDDPLGKEVLFENFKTFVITGVVEDPPAQSHLQFDLLGSLSTMNNWGLDVYGDNQLNAAYVYVYLLLHENTDLNKLAININKEISKIKSQESTIENFELQSLNQIHLYSDLDHEIADTGQGKKFWILGSVALLILILGWVNHFNLFTAGALDQYKTLSIRKIIGAERKHLFNQLLVAAMLISFCGLFVGLILVEVFEPIIANFFQIPFQDFKLFDFNLANPAFYLMSLLMVGTLAIGILPASLLSQINPVKLLSKRVKTNTPGFYFQKWLVAFQFTIIITLLICTGIIFQQTQYMQEKKLGMSLENVIAIRGPLGVRDAAMQTSFPQFQNQMMSLPGIDAMSKSHHLPGNQLEMIQDLKLDEKVFSFGFYRNYGDPDYFRVYSIPFIVQDTSISFIHQEKRYAFINKMACDLLGFKDPSNALRQKITRWGTELKIAGVVENHHQRSLHHTQLPIIYDISQNSGMTDGYYSFKINATTHPPSLIPNIKEAYNRLFPYTVFDPIDVQSHFQAQYQSDNHFKTLNVAFTLLGILIACMGLLGLIMIAVSKRTKEISIRKVLGASILAILTLMSKDYMKLIGIALLIATPIAYILMYRWLQNFNYRIDIPWWIFLLAGLITAGLALLTISYQGLKAATVNPAETLKND